METPPVSKPGRPVIGSLLHVCEVTGKRTLPKNLVRSAVSGKPILAEIATRCQVSGEPAIAEELSTCESTGKRVLPNLLDSCAVSGKPVVRGLLRPCEVTGKQVLPEYLARCTRSGKVILSKLLEASELSGEMGLRDLLVSCETSGRRVFPDEIVVTDVGGKKVAKDRVRVCTYCGGTADIGEVRRCFTCSEWCCPRDMSDDICRCCLGTISQAEGRKLAKREIESIRKYLPWVRGGWVVQRAKVGRAYVLALPRWSPLPRLGHLIVFEVARDQYSKGPFQSAPIVEQSLKSLAGLQKESASRWAALVGKATSRRVPKTLGQEAPQ